MSIGRLRQRALGLLVSGAFLLACGGSASAEGPSGCTRAQTIVVGKIAQKASEALPKVEPFGQRLVVELAGQGIRCTDVLVASDLSKMAELFRSGRVDILSETVFSALVLERDGLADLLLREWKSGVPSYRSLFVVRSDSPFQQLKDLGGNRIALEDRRSTSGYAVPVLLLRQFGLEPTISSDAGKVESSEVRIDFAGQEVNIVAWVVRRRADAGAISDADWRNPQRVPDAFKAQLRILHESPPIIRSLLVVRRDIPAELKVRLKEALLRIHKSVEGIAALKTYFGVERFDALEGEARGELDYARELFAQMRAED